jgi:hypothetical protein
MFSNPVTLRILGKALLDAAEAIDSQSPARYAGTGTVGASADPPPPTDEPTAEPLTVPPYAPGIPVDVDGRPHDPRIDAAAGTKKVDGRWKQLPGVDKDLVTRIKALYAGWGPAPAPVEEAPPPPPEEAPPPPPPAQEVTDFPGFVKHATGLIQAKKLDWATINAVCGTLGIGNFTDLNAHPELIPAVLASLPS